MARKGFAELLHELQAPDMGSDLDSSDEDNDDYIIQDYEIDHSTDDSSDGQSDPDMPGPSNRATRGRKRGRGIAAENVNKRRRPADRGDGGGMDTENDDDNGWREDLEGFPSHITFNGDSGLHLPDTINDDSDPLDFFLLIFSKDLMKTIKQETNRYAQEQLQQREPLSPQSRYKDWTTVTLKDLRKFFTVLIHMSLVKKGSILDYWSTMDIVKCSFASSVMPRDRFLLMLSFLHLNDNSTYIPRGNEGHDPLHKVRPVYDHLRNKFKTLYTPTQDVSIDEAMCPWKGNINYRVYMKDKPTKWGIKLYELCESDSGYVFDFEIYCGFPGLSNRPVDVCLRLMEPLLDKGFTLFTDNYYSCPELSNKLADRDTNTVGTVRNNRVGLSRAIRVIPLQKGDIAFRRKGPLVYLRWKDKKDVYLLTTVHNPLEKTTVTTRAGTKEKPKAIQNYIMKMGGVDHSDQLMSYVPLHRRTTKCWKKVFFHLFALALLQSQILYNKHRRQNKNPPLKLSDFLKALGTQMNQRCLRDDGDRILRQPTAAPANRLAGNHFIFPLPATASKSKPRRDCKVCKEKALKLGTSTGRKRVETYFWCPDCGVALCIGQCFKDYHSKVDYTA